MRFGVRESEGDRRRRLELLQALVLDLPEGPYFVDLHAALGALQELRRRAAREKMDAVLAAKVAAREEREGKS